MKAKLVIGIQRAKASGRDRCYLAVIGRPDILSFGCVQAPRIRRA